MKTRKLLMNLAHTSAAFTVGLVIMSIDSFSTPALFILCAFMGLLVLADYLAHQPGSGYDLIAHQVAAEQGFDLGTLDSLDRYKDAQFKRDFDKEL